MSGHSAFKNKKHRKSRQDLLKSKRNLQVNREIERIIEREKIITNKVWELARINNFPKEKIDKIKKKLLANDKS